MISDAATLIFMVVLCALVGFSLWLFNHRRRFLLPRIYLAFRYLISSGWSRCC